MSLGDFDAEEERARVAAIAEGAPEQRRNRVAAASSAAAPFELDQEVDVDLCLSLNDADCDQIAAEADAMFDVIDKDGNGVVSREELEAHLARQQPPGAIDRMFSVMDANADGVISRQELRDAFCRYENTSLRLALGLAAVAAGAEELLGGSLKRLTDTRTVLADELFDAVDANGDDELSSAELQAHLRGTGYSPRTVGAIFDSLDLNQARDPNPNPNPTAVTLTLTLTPYSTRSTVTRTAGLRATSCASALRATTSRRCGSPCG